MRCGHKRLSPRYDSFTVPAVAFKDMGATKMFRKPIRRATPVSPAGKTAAHSRRFARRLFFSTAVLILLLSPIAGAGRLAQGGGHILFGDLKVDESKGEGLKPIAFDIVLYTEAGSIAGRQTIPNNGRYRFMSLDNGNYDVVVEVENREVARLRVYVSSPFKNDFRQDISLAWDAEASGAPKKGTVSAADFYKRTSANQELFDKVNGAIKKQKYDEAAALLQRIVRADPKDYPAWTELGTMNYATGKAAEAEQNYLRALGEKPDFLRAAINLGRLRTALKNFDGAISVLSAAVEKHPRSPDANHLLGEAYLQIKKGSKAVSYLNEAIRLDPLGKADVHLRLATLYNGAGMKDKAAIEYELFLTKKPDYADKKKLRQYIAENKKP